MAALDIAAPGTDAFATACGAYNTSVTLAPVTAVIAATADEVREAVLHAREQGLKVAVQGTGHRAIALPPLDGALLIRTALTEPVAIDPERRVARAPAGARWRDVLPLAAEHGLTALHGSSPSVGVAGYSVGGGLGFYARRHGLMCNTVRAFDVVTADGVARTVDAERDPDLFWALRGGRWILRGGHRGRVRPAADRRGPGRLADLAGGLRPQVLRAWAEWCATAPEEITTTCRFLRLPPIPEVPEPLRGTPVISINGVFLGDAADGERLIAPFRDIAPMVFDTWQTMRSADVAGLHADPDLPLPYNAGSALLSGVDDDLIDVLVEIAGEAAADCPLVALELRQLGGALARAPEGAGATSGLPGEFLLFGIGVTPEPAVAEAVAACVRQLFGAAAPWTIERRYLLYDEAHGPARPCYAAADYDRLCAIRARYDPDDRFVGTHRIEPLTT